MKLTLEQAAVLESFFEAGSAWSVTTYSMALDERTNVDLRLHGRLTRNELRILTDMLSKAQAVRP